MSKVVVKEVDLSNIKSKVGYLIPGTNSELAIIRYFKLVTTNANDNIITNTNKYLYYKVSGDSVENYTYKKLLKYLDEAIYTNIFFKFLGNLEQLLLANTTPDILNIEYDSVVDASLYRFKFRYTYKD